MFSQEQIIKDCAKVHLPVDGADHPNPFTNNERMKNMVKEIKEIDTSIMLEMGERIRQARIEKGYQSKDMALFLDMSKDNYSRIENGQQLCTTKNLYKIAQVLDVSIDYLLFNAEEDGYIAEVRMLFKDKGLEKIRKAIVIIRAFFE